MKKWIPFLVTSCIALICSFLTVIVGIWAYLAVTGLDLLVSAKYTAPRVMVIFAVLTFVLWVAAVVIFLVTKPHKNSSMTDKNSAD